MIHPNMCSPFYDRFARIVVGTLLGLCLAIFASGLHAACSSHLGSATLNEIFKGTGSGSGRFIEVKLLDTSIPAAVYTDWNISICYGSTPTCTSITLGNNRTGPYIVTGKNLSTNFYYSNQNTEMDFALLDADGNFIDYFSINGYSRSPAPACSFPYDTALSLAQNPFNISRIPDGTGDWSYQPGNSGDITEGFSNTGTEQPVLHHLRLLHAGQGLTCQAEYVTVMACADAGNDTSCSAYTDGVSGNLTAGAQLIPFAIPADQSMVQLAVRQTSEATLLLGTSVGSYDDSMTRCYIGATQNCQLQFVDTALIFSPAPYDAVLPHQTSGVPQAIYLAAIRTDEATGACGPALEGSQSVNLAYECINPSACHTQDMLLLNTQTITRNNAGAVSTYAPQTLNFNSAGVAQLAFDYRDVGAIALHANLYLADPGSTLVGRSNDFVVRPHNFLLTIADNPAAADHQGGVFTVAGEDFPVVVSAVNALGGLTPSFGRETPAQEVMLDLALLAPAGGNAPTLGGSLGNFGEDCDVNPSLAGSACGLFNWPEVGIITLTPSVDDYLGTGTVIGNVSDNIGRFIPSYFHMEAVLQTAACEDGSAPFTYYGQDSLETQFSIEARNRLHQPTRNYRGDFAKLDFADWSSYRFTADSLPGGVILEAATQEPQVMWEEDFAAITAYHRASRPADPIVPASISISAEPEDSDGVSTNSVLPVHTDSFELRYGRLRLQNAHGSELLDLSIPAYTEYYQSNGLFVRNTDDHCTTLSLAEHLQLRDDEGNWIGGDSLVSLTDGSGNTSASLLHSPLHEGEAGLSFASPGAGNTGYVDIRSRIAVEFPWLAFPWNCDTGAPNEACARASFGIYQGNLRQIYLRERY